MTGRILVWDLPVRAFHWALAVLVVFSYVAGKIGGGWMEWHLRSGYTIFALLLFRLAWGVAGSATPRFTPFLRGPRAAIDFVGHLFAGPPPLLGGPKPLGGWMGGLILATPPAQGPAGPFAAHA